MAEERRGFAELRNDMTFSYPIGVQDINPVCRNDRYVTEVICFFIFMGGH